VKRFAKITTRLSIGVLTLLGFALPSEAQTAETPEPKTQIFASILYNGGTLSLTDQRTFTLFAEEGSFAGDWSTGSGGAAFGIGAARTVWRQLSVGAALEISNGNPTESFETRLPHPFFFDQHRSLEGEETSLSYRETAIHVLVGYTKTSSRVVISVDGGPSYFLTRSDVVGDLTFADNFPFDSVTLLSVERVTEDANGMGFNVGGRVSYRVTPILAVGADLRFSRASVKFTSTGGDEVEFDAGGPRIGAGVTVTF